MTERIGILGAGQLGGYLCMAARSLGFETTVLANNPAEMAVALADEARFESSDPIADLEFVMDRCNYVTFEKEDIDPALLERLREREAKNALRVAPSVDTMLLLQNKALQKRWLSEQALPIAEFIEIEHKATTDSIRARLGSPFVVKTERGGYDGLGVRVIHTDDPIQDLGAVPSIAERYIDQREEFAVLVVRTVRGETIAYPTVEMMFDPEGNLLRTILAPARLSAAQRQAAEALAVTAIDRLGTAGVFAVELFYTDATWLINEVSPRVHNSGHHTLDAAATSQFEQHIRALTGMPLGPVEPVQPAALINLLCEPALHHICCSDQQRTAVADQVFVHWYGKKSMRHLRKMGHLTALGRDPEAALGRAEAEYANLSESANNSLNDTAIQTETST